jgi:hypothetical protein
MTELIRKLLQEQKPADAHGDVSEENAKCNGCGQRIHDLHWILCGRCKEDLCVWCIQKHRLHGGEFHWSMTQEPVDFALLSTCTRPGCGHFAIMHETVTGKCLACRARTDKPDDPDNAGLLCLGYHALEAGSELTSDPARFWRAYEIACAKSYEAYIKPLLKKGAPKKEVIPFTDRAVLIRVCKQEYDWGHHLVDKMIQQALDAGALLRTPARDMTDSKFIGKFVTVYIKQKKV